MMHGLRLVTEGQTMKTMISLLKRTNKPRLILPKITERKLT